MNSLTLMLTHRKHKLFVQVNLLFAPKLVRKRVMAVSFASLSAIQCRRSKNLLWIKSMIVSMAGLLLAPSTQDLTSTLNLSMRGTFRTQKMSMRISTIQWIGTGLTMMGKMCLIVWVYWSLVAKAGSRALPVILSCQACLPHVKSTENTSVTTSTLS